MKLLNKIVYAKARNTKKAAMFGLDARIALAIFGALSVISGAALYSAIEKSKTTAFIAYASEIGKAWEEYYLNTGSKLTYVNSSTSDPYYYYRKVEDLITDPGVTGWKGHYLSTTVKNAYSLFYPGNDKVSIAIAYMRNPNSSGISNAYCPAGISDCKLWVQFSGVAADIDIAFIKALDLAIDGVAGPTTGDFRWFNSTYTYFFVKIMATKPPMDS